MLVEKALNEALIDYTKGKKVYIVQEYDDKSMDISNLADFLEEEGVRMLVDVPTVENPKWNKHIAEMVAGNHPDIDEATVIPDKESCGATATKGEQEDSESQNFSGGVLR